MSRPIEGDLAPSGSRMGRRGSAATAAPPNPNDNAAIQSARSSADRLFHVHLRRVRLCAIPASDRPSANPQPVR